MFAENVENYFNCFHPKYSQVLLLAVINQSNVLCILLLIKIIWNTIYKPILIILSFIVI